VLQAAILCLTQPASQLRSSPWRRQFGVKLFMSTGKELQLTDPAREILPAVEELYKKAKEVEYTLHSFKDSRTGVLRLTTSRSISQAYVPSPS